MITPLLYVWGDDELVAERLVGRFATALAGELGEPMDRWDLRGDLATAAEYLTVITDAGKVNGEPLSITGAAIDREKSATVNRSVRQTVGCKPA